MFPLWEEESVLLMTVTFFPSNFPGKELISTLYLRSVVLLSLWHFLIGYRLGLLAIASAITSAVALIFYAEITKVITLVIRSEFQSKIIAVVPVSNLADYKVSDWNRLGFCRNQSLLLFAQTICISTTIIWCQYMLFLSSLHNISAPAKEQILISIFFI